MLRKIESGLIFIAVFITVFWIVDYILTRDSTALCEKPIAYTIGTFDRRFGISQTDFLEALAQAETIWEESIDQELFVYAPETAVLPVNLIYDYRQETTNTLTFLGSTLEENDASYKILQGRHTGLKAEFEKAKSIYETRVKIFNETSNAYELQVEKWNSGPRTSRAQFDRLEESRKTLEAEAVILKNLEKRLNEVVREINTLVDELNRLVKILNLNVEAYNTIGGLRGESFTGGDYFTDSESQGINIYEFSSKDKLIRVLAHELGHALGLEHVDDPEAIMYYLNEGGVGRLSETDLAALQTLCYNGGVIN